jgi:hypothetical protein
MNEILANRLVGILKGSDLMEKSFHNKTDSDHKTITDFETSQVGSEWKIFAVFETEEALGNTPRCELNMLFTNYSEVF